MFHRRPHAPHYDLSRRPRRCLAGLLACCALLLAACQGDPRAERIAKHEAVINISADPRTLDPSLATDVASARALLCLMRGLTNLNEAGDPQPELAQSWTVSPDGKTYEFTLRPGLTWSDGSPLTAEDFVYTYTHRMLNPAFGAETSYMLFILKGAREYYQNNALGAQTVGVEAVAPDRLRLTLTDPAPYFLQLITHHSFFPVSARLDQANPKWAQRAETHLGCGPFTIESYQPGSELVARKNPRYWNAAQVRLERVRMPMIELESTARIAMEAGEIDATEGVPRSDIDALRGTPELRFSNMFSTYNLFFNVERPHLRDPRVRRALALAIDRAAIVKSVTRAGERPAFFFSPPELYRQPPRPGYADAAYDEARKLLAEAGYPGGKGLPTLRYIYNTNENHRQIAQVLQETWKRELGVEVSVENLEFKVLINERRAGNFDIARGGWVADYKDPVSFLETMLPESENNDSHWKDPRYADLLTHARETLDPTAREAVLAQAEAYLMQEMPIATIYYYTTPCLITPRLKGFALGPTGMFDIATTHWE